MKNTFLGLSGLVFAVVFASCTQTPAPTAVTVNISSPSAQVFTNGSVTIQVVVTGDPTTVDLLKNGTPLVTLAAPYQYTWDTTVEPEATYDITARASKSGVTPVVSAAKQITVDRTAPSITARSPVNAATNVFLADEISVTFNEPMLSSSVTATTVQLKQGSNQLARNTSLNSAGTKLVVVPTGLPTLPATLNLVVNGLTDRAGNVVSNNTGSFGAPDWQQPGTQPLDLNSANVADISTRSTVLDSSGNPVVTWSEITATTYNVYVKRWNGSSWVQVGSTLNMDPNTNAYRSTIVLDSSGNPVVAWYENNDIFVKRWNGSSWDQVGSSSLDFNASQVAGLPSIALDSNGNPVVAWSELNGTNSRIYVKGWNGSSWDQVGSSLNINANRNAYYPSLAADPNGSLVVAWQETDMTSSNIYVKRWNGSSWVSLGLALDNLISRSTQTPSIAVDPNGVPVVAWVENTGTYNNIFVKRWNGSSWVPLGSTLNIDANQSAYEPSIILNPSDNYYPAVAWTENDGTSHSIFVKRWNGSSWVQFGLTSLDVNTDLAAFRPSIALDSDGNPVVAWRENDGTSESVYLKRYNRIP